MSARRGEIELPTYPWLPAVKHPYFRGTDGKNIYPYPMLDQLQRTSQPQRYRTVVLENDYLRLTFLPELGGKVWEVIDKTAGTPMFYVNHVVKPALIGQCGAWISGGIEFNTGPAGHTVSAMQPVTVEILPPASDGSRSVAVGEVERIYGTRWTVVVTLRPDRAFIEETIRIYNPTETVRPYYFWNCTAAPNPPGFRFVYPMTLGTDHAGTTFYTWPIANGKDLTRGTNYQDASSIFAYRCDQDFFGSYDEGSGYGVVAYANHYQVPGKKAWTWGQGSYGTMHQMDLTDSDGPYNEVQTGPLPTQADVGRLEPNEAVSWQEWWYPVRNLGTFTYANRELAANARAEGPSVAVDLFGSGSWKGCQVNLSKDGKVLACARCDLSPRSPAVLRLNPKGTQEPWEVEVTCGNVHLAHFRVPLDLPVRTPPAKAKPAASADEFVTDGWQEFLFAKYPSAQKQFERALTHDTNSVGAHTGMAYLHLEDDPSRAATAARTALALDPGNGSARFALAVAEERLGQPKAALEDAWAASLEPGTATASRALLAKLLLRSGKLDAAVSALSEPGPWQEDPVCRNRLAMALAKRGTSVDRKAAIGLAKANLQVDALDVPARAVLWLLKSEDSRLSLDQVLGGGSKSMVNLVVDFAEVGWFEEAFELVRQFGGRGDRVKRQPQSGPAADPLLCYWAAWLGDKVVSRQAIDRAVPTATWLKEARTANAEGVFPHHRQTAEVLKWALRQDPNDGKAELYLGHALFSLGRYDEGRRHWQRAAELGAAPAIAYRALGMAAQQLDNDAAQARRYLEKANEADAADSIVARDLARVLFSLAEKAEGDAKKTLVVQARQVLQGAFEEGKGRSDFVALLAGANNRLGDFQATSKLLDSVRITIWEGAREAHDLFEQAHLALGKGYLKAGSNDLALAEFNRALEYPKNLATGKLENAREAHIHYLRGNALSALGRKAEAREAWRKAADEPASQGAAEEARLKAREALKAEQQN